MKQPLIILSGPTAVGKTKASIGLAHRLGGEIVSVDSMQVYKHMDIGSAKIKPEEMEGVPHHLIDVLEPEEEFHVQKFQQMAKEALARIYAAGHVPIVTGGTGFYIQALLYDIQFTMEESDPAYRQELAEYARKYGQEALHEKLREVDPVSAEKIHANNVKRVIRALEYFHQNQEPISRHNEEERKRISPYRFVYFVLDDTREHLYQRIDARVDQMVQDGLVEEVKALKAAGCTRKMVSMQGLGYKEILEYLDQEISLEEAIYKLKRDTRHFAKRQLTWFRRERDVTWINKADYGYQEELILDKMLEECAKVQIFPERNENGTGNEGHV